MEFKLNTKYVQEMATVKFARYADGGVLCIELVSPDSGEKLCRATFNPEDVNGVFNGLGEGAKDLYVCIKTWSENAGVLEELIKHDIVDYPIIGGVATQMVIPAGFVTGQLMRLTDTALEEMQKQLNVTA